MLREYALVLWQRKWIVLVCLAVVPAVAVLLALRQPTRHLASADVLLSPSATALLTGTAPQSLSDATLADLARVPAVAQRALDAAHVTDRSAAALLAESSVGLKPNESILTVSVTDRDPTIAARLATAYARQYVLYRHRLEVGAIESARAVLQARIDKLTGTHEVSPATLDSLRSREQQLSALEVLQTTDATVVRTAQGAAALAPHPIRDGLIGLLVGAVLGTGLALLRNEFDTRVRTSHEIRERLQLPLLGRIPEPPRSLRSKDRLTMLAEPRGIHAETMRVLRTNVELALFERNIHTIMVTSGAAGEGKTTTISNLAVAFARAGRRVVLVDLDLRGPALHRFFDHHGQTPGLTQVVLGEATLDNAFLPVAIGGPKRLHNRASDGEGPIRAGGSLFVLCSGPPPPDPGEFVAARALGTLFDSLRERADLVLVDAPPLLGVGDAVALSAHVDALLVVTKLATVRRPMITEMRRMLETIRVRKLGFVITDADAESSYGYGYDYGYGYGAGYGHPFARSEDELVL